MATADQHPVDITATAGADLSAALFNLVEGGSSVTVSNGQGEPCLGFLQNKPASGKPASVRVGGTSKAIAASTITQGQQLTSDGTGKVEPAATGDNIIGVALGAADASDVFQVLVRPNGISA